MKMPCLGRYLAFGRLPQGYGGTGRTSDWGNSLEFLRAPREELDSRWGLGPDNLEAALLETQAKQIDLNSGVEGSPGIKDPSNWSWSKGSRIFVIFDSAVFTDGDLP